MLCAYGAAAMEALALLHCHLGHHQAALELFLQLSPQHADVFSFVERHRLHGFLRPHVRLLISHGWHRALALLLRCTEALPPAEVTRQLEQHGHDEGEAERRRLHEYLHGLFLQDLHVSAAFHTRQLELYATIAPELLLPFLMSSPHYNLDAALLTCRLHELVDCEVYVLRRMGLNREALGLMLEPQDDMAGAIEFVHRAGDHKLWQQLLSHAYGSAQLAKALLEQVCRSPLIQLEPLTLMRKLPGGINIPGLKVFVQKILAQASNQLDLTEGCLRVALSNTTKLAHDRHRCQRRGTVHTTDAF